MPHTYRLPDYSETTDIKYFLRSWEDIYKPLCKTFGVRVIAFDPGVTFEYKGVTFDLPVDFIKELNKKL